MTIKELRTEKGKTQVEMAVAVGVSLTSYRLWESGATKPNDENMAKLKEVLGVGE